MEQEWTEVGRKIGYIELQKRLGIVLRSRQHQILVGSPIHKQLLKFVHWQ